MHYKTFLKMPESLPNGQYNLSVNVIGQKSYGFQGILQSINCQSNDPGLFIVTDKPVYNNSDNGTTTQKHYDYF